jgi:hypothetical protein
VGAHSSIPLDEEDSAAWEEALGIMHHKPVCDITWENAARLLVLADKYDVACIIGRMWLLAQVAILREHYAKRDIIQCIPPRLPLCFVRLMG